MKRFTTSTGKLAWCGVMTAVSLVLQLLGGLIGIGTYAAPVLGAVCTWVVLYYSDQRTAVLHWLATGILSLILCADKELALLYLFLLGWYPIAKPTLDRVRPKVLRLLCKLLIFNAVILATYAILLMVVYGGEWEALGFGGLGMTIVFLILGNVIFLMCDWLLGKLHRKFH